MEPLWLGFWIFGLSFIGMGCLIVDMIIGYHSVESFEIYDNKPSKSFQESILIQDDYDNIDKYVYSETEEDNLIDQESSEESNTFDKNSFMDDFDF